MLIQLCYCSKYKPRDFTLVEDIRDILTTAKKFNYQHNVHGTLYYADGSFLQCLEGEEKIIRDLYTSIQKDRRHELLNLLKVERIDDIKFKKWTMKYVGLSSPIKKLFSDLNFSSFVPDQINEEQLNKIVDILYLETEEDIESNHQGFKSRGYSHYF